MAGPARTSIRLKVLRMAEVSPHRYRLWRAASQTISLAILVLLPLLHVAQVDFWRGEHFLLGRPAPFKHALAGVIVAIAAMYVVTFLSNLAAGRLFCGWGCPVGQVSRMGERLEMPGLKGRRLAWAYLWGGAYSALFVIAVLAWWVDLRVLVQGTPRALVLSWGLVALGVGGAYLHARVWRWEFCKSACPIGLYYSFVSPAKYFGVHFRNQDHSCIECDACDHVCPVNLTPRDLVAPVTNRTGISIGDAPGHNHCLECGDCIVACERMVSLKASKRDGAGVMAIAPLKLGWFRGEQHITDTDTSVLNPKLAPENLPPSTTPTIAPSAASEKEGDGAPNPGEVSHV